VIAHFFLGGLLMAATVQDERAIQMEVAQDGETIEVTLIGNSTVEQRVEYELELSGNSNSNHKGSTVLAANSPAVLSTMRMHGGRNWCVKAIVREEDGKSYEYSEGTCA